ncbi:MAG: type III pantothenate kinase [Treponema sp.]|jgi:type III pantothenate kinase|nr:type III pantothenate kinase [Treponema sp.]
MLLAIDIGNTSIVASLFHKDEIIHEWRIHTDSKRTADEYSSILTSLFRDHGVTVASIKNAVLSTVVPALLGPFIRLTEKMIGKKPVIVSTDIYDKLPITIPATAYHEIGTDLVCNSVEAFCRWKKPVIVVDFGTALTFTAIDGKGNIQGVAITPGLGTAVNSLFSNTAQLPSVPLIAPQNALGKNTTHAIQAGIVLGYKGLVESLIEQIKNDLIKITNCSKTEIKVVATGGLNSVLKPITDVLQEVDKQLTLRGLKRISDILANN